MSTEFHVEYRIEVTADSPREAALQVAQLLTERAERGVYHVRRHSASGTAHWEEAIDLSACAKCGTEDDVGYGKDDDLCYDCYMESTGWVLCPNCGEWVEGPLNEWPELNPPVIMCDSCLHNARRSGWEPGVSHS